eukprot:scaffold27011_cov63-Phaeocystis_antarctica.AAC.4
MLQAATPCTSGCSYTHSRRASLPRTPPTTSGRTRGSCRCGGRLRASASASTAATPTRVPPSRRTTTQC